MSTTGRLFAAIATLATLSAVIAASGSSATAQTTPDTAVLALEADGVLAGTKCSPEDCEGDLIRWETAFWLNSALDLSPMEAVSFHDVAANGDLSGAVSSLYGDGVTVGCTAEPLRYCPDDHTTRAQMASFLARAFDLEAGERDVFADVDPDSVHARNISAISEAGITRGCAQDPLRYCPRDPITRKQAALMLYRALQRFDGSADSATVETTNGPTGPTVVPTVPTTPTTTAPTVPTTPTTTAPTVPTTPTTTAPTVSPVPPGCAVVDHFNTSHDIDGHDGDPTKTAWALLADGTLFAHRHLPGGGALCWMWAPSSPDEEPPFPQNVRPPSHTH